MQIYLDHNGTTPLHKRVQEKIIDFWEKEWGNPSSLHSFGIRARQIREEARKRVALCIGASPGEILFTSGGTEANSLALLGAARFRKKEGLHIISSRIEHPAVLNNLEILQKEGFEITLLKVDRWGRVDPEDLQKNLRTDTILVSIMAANNETGTLQPVKEIGEILASHQALFHCDAVQALGKMDFSVDLWKVDLLTLSGHKIGAPMGVGALYRRKGVALSPLFGGGHQEEGLRGGTENLSGIVGFGEACQILLEEKDEPLRLLELKEKLEGLIRENLPRCLINTPKDSLPNTLNVTFLGAEGEQLLFSLDLEGIAVSTGSACASGSPDPSHVLLAMGLSKRDALSTLRISLGRDNTEDHIEKLVEALKRALAH